MIRCLYKWLPSSVPTLFCSLIPLTGGLHPGQRVAKPDLAAWPGSALDVGLLKVHQVGLSIKGGYPNSWMLCKGESRLQMDDDWLDPYETSKGVFLLYDFF